MRVLLAFLLSGVVSACLVSCTSPFVIKLEGHFGEPITFHFYNSANDEKPSKMNIVGFRVEEQMGETQWTTVWELKGAQSLSEISYGGKYNGLTESVMPKQLSPRGKYRAIAVDRGLLGKGGYSSVYFSFNESGDIVHLSMRTSDRIRFV